MITGDIWLTMGIISVIASIIFAYVVVSRIKERELREYLTSSKSENIEGGNYEN